MSRQKTEADENPDNTLKKGLALALLFIAIDQLHKYIMLYVVNIAEAPIAVTGFFNLVMVWNRGVSFGMFNRPDIHEYQPLILILVALVIVGVLVHWLRKAESRLEMWALALVIGGALGNVIDRAVYGAVADFFDVYVGNWHWPAFNIADSFICIGVFLLVTDGIFDITGKKKN